MLAKVLDIAKRKGDWVTARDVQLGFTLKKRPKAEVVRQWFKELEQLHLGTIQGQGRQVKFCSQCSQNVNGLTTDKMQTGQSSQPFVVNVVNFHEQKEEEISNEEKISNSQNPTTTTTNSRNQDLERPSDVDSPDYKRLQRLQTDHKIQIGSTVKIHLAGSMRDGEIGTVLSIDESGFATVRLHNKSLRRDLQIISAPIAKEPGQVYYLELIE